MDWSVLAYTRSSNNAPKPFIYDHLTRPCKVLWSRHALWRAEDRGHMSSDDAKRWFSTTQYLGRWAHCEVWGDEYFVVTGIRKGTRPLLTITTFMPRAYWAYDVSRYDMMMDKLEIRDESHGKNDHLRTLQ